MGNRNRIAKKQEKLYDQKKMLKNNMMNERKMKNYVNK